VLAHRSAGLPKFVRGGPPDAQNFEELMGSMNTYNRTLEDIHGVGKEFGSVAQLWGRFNELIRKQQVSCASN
jgi:DASH complex subunit DAD1